MGVHLLTQLYFFNLYPATVRATDRELLYSLLI